MKKKLLIIAGTFVLCCGLLAGCGSSRKINDFIEFKDLTQNPSKLIYATNLHNEIGDGIYGDLIEYEVPHENITEIMDSLFSVTLKAMPKNIDIDLPSLSRFLIVYDGSKSWQIYIGFQVYKERWYKPSGHDTLIKALDALTIS